MQREVMFAGFGGQGILISAKILARTAMQEGRDVAWVLLNLVALEEGQKVVMAMA